MNDELSSQTNCGHEEKPPKGEVPMNPTTTEMPKIWKSRLLRKLLQ